MPLHPLYHRHLLLAVALPLLLVAPSAPDRLVVPFAELTDGDLELIDLHDGTVHDWEQVLGTPVLTGRDAYTGQGYSWFPYYESADFDFRIWLAWHDATNRIYVAVEQFDDIYENEYQRPPTGSRDTLMDEHDSGVEIILDGDRSGGSLVLLDTQGMTRWEVASAELLSTQEYYALAETHDSGSHVNMGQAFRDWMLHPPFCDGSGRRFGSQPIITVLEFYVTPFDRLLLDSPEQSTPSDLHPGHIIGFDLALHDWDFGQGTIYRFSDTFAFWQLDLLSHGIMVGKAQAGSGLDGLAESSWATVKHAPSADSLAPQP